MYLLKYIINITHNSLKEITLIFPFSNQCNRVVSFFIRAV